MNSYTSTEARPFADEWLPAWTGNRPEFLASFCSNEAFYLDPGVPAGIRGKTELLVHCKETIGVQPELGLVPDRGDLDGGRFFE